jgi:hypothetical protein
MARRKQFVWVVMHYEIIGTPKAPQIDSIQFHVSSSLAKAEAYIRSCWVDAHSWWQVHPHEVNATDRLNEGEEVYFYTRRGARLRSAPTAKAIAAFRKHVARYPEIYQQD